MFSLGKGEEMIDPICLELDLESDQGMKFPFPVGKAKLPIWPRAGAQGVLQADVNGQKVRV